MPLKDTGTEQSIKDTAKHILFAEGKLHATTQEIADAAGVNRSAVHYYFRSRDQLIAAVFVEAMNALSERLDQCMESPLPFREKVERLISVFLDDMISYPYQETFLVTEINTLGKHLLGNLGTGPVHSFLEEIAAEMERGSIQKMEPINFFMNLFSLLSYPLIMAPLYRELFQINEKNYQELAIGRKKMILNMIFNPFQ
ncbi:MAG: TetR/AcrR family transcriptional regulator [Bacteroidota bacterium]